MPILKSTKHCWCFSPSLETSSRSQSELGSVLTASCLTFLASILEYALVTDTFSVMFGHFGSNDRYFWTISVQRKEPFDLDVTCCNRNFLSYNSMLGGKSYRDHTRISFRKHDHQISSFRKYDMRSYYSDTDICLFFDFHQWVYFSETDVSPSWISRNASLSKDFDIWTEKANIIPTYTDIENQNYKICFSTLHCCSIYLCSRLFSLQIGFRKYWNCSERLALKGISLLRACTLAFTSYNNRCTWTSVSRDCFGHVLQRKALDMPEVQKTPAQSQQKICFRKTDQKSGKQVKANEIWDDTHPLHYTASLWVISNLPRFMHYRL